MQEDLNRGSTVLLFGWGVCGGGEGGGGGRSVKRREDLLFNVRARTERGSMKSV